MGSKPKKKNLHFWLWDALLECLILSVDDHITEAAQKIYSFIVFYIQNDVDDYDDDDDDDDDHDGVNVKLSKQSSLLDDTQALFLLFFRSLLSHTTTKYKK